jgi:cobalt-zinc-cadmium resistance protein CzcA
MLPLRPKESEGSVITGLRGMLSRVLDVVLRHRAATVGIAFGLFVAAIAVAMTRGAEFIPELDEGAIALEVYRLPSMSLTEATHQTTRLEQTLLQFSEVESVVCKTGRSEIAMDPMGVEMTDVLVTLKPRDTWRFDSREALIEAAAQRLREQVPGIVFGFSQPIEMRMNELIAGSRADIAVKLYGEDLEVLRERADVLVRVLREVPGAEDVRAEQISGLPMLRVHVDRQAAARYGVRVQDVLDTVAALGGIQVTQVYEGSLPYAVEVRVDPATRREVSLLESLPVGASGGQTVPLSQVADLEEEIGPAQVSREDLERRITVQVNVRGRDIASFVADAQRRVAREVRLPPRYRFEWGGQFEHLQSATERLTLVIPLVLLLILVLLYTSFGALRPAAIIFLNVPLSVTGGVAALAVRGMPLSISAGIGFIALFGVAVLNGLVLVSTARQHEIEGATSTVAVRRAALERMRPVLMTALVAALGFVPMALSETSGAEVQRPLATVFIGGILSSTLLTLLVLPAVYSKFGGSKRAVPDKDAAIAPQEALS